MYVCINAGVFFSLKKYKLLWRDKMKAAEFIKIIDKSIFKMVTEKLIIIHRSQYSPET